jgi:hypothetical protein
MTLKDQSKSTTEPVSKPTKKPNETGSINVEGFVKIFDPTTKETFVEKRA